ncbi:MAG: ribonuclease Z, partial [Caldilineaceae bacterium]|nr:ribonuclease Z [Caldilineaceae bacterium]
RLARNAGVRHLVLHHVSRRYRNQDILDEARAIFPDTSLAYDFDHYQVTRDKPVRVTNLRYDRK